MSQPPDTNPTLHPRALSDAERDPQFKWHRYASSERSSQVFCLSAFGTLRSMKSKDAVLEGLFRSALPAFPMRDLAHQWSIQPEAEDPALLCEFGTNQPSSIDMLCVSADEVICIESKFATDAEHGFGACSQYPKACAGYHGPGSDRARQSNAWCRLETWERSRSPRAYWSLAKGYFRPEVYTVQSEGDTCPLRGPNYQLMRNFLFAAAKAERDRKSMFGVVTIAPRRFADRLARQVDAFRQNVLLPAYADNIAHVDYEAYAECLRATQQNEAIGLAGFLEERIAAVASAAAA